MHRIGRGWGLELRRQARHGRELCVALERILAADGVIFLIFLRFPFRKSAKESEGGGRRRGNGEREERCLCFSFGHASPASGSGCGIEKGSGSELYMRVEEMGPGSI